MTFITTKSTMLDINTSHISEHHAAKDLGKLIERARITLEGLTARKGLQIHLKFAMKHCCFVFRNDTSKASMKIWVLINLVRVTMENLPV